MRDFNVEVAMATGILHVNLIFPIFSDFHLLQNVHQAHFPKWYLRSNYTFRNLIKREFERKGVVCSLNGKYARKVVKKLLKILFGGVAQSQKAFSRSYSFIFVRSH